MISNWCNWSIFDWLQRAMICITHATCGYGWMKSISCFDRSLASNCKNTTKHVGNYNLRSTICCIFTIFKVVKCSDENQNERMFSAATSTRSSCSRTRVHCAWSAIIYKIEEKNRRRNYWRNCSILLCDDSCMASGMIARGESVWPKDIYTSWFESIQGTWNTFESNLQQYHLEASDASISNIKNWTHAENECGSLVPSVLAFVQCPRKSIQTKLHFVNTYFAKVEP